MKNEIIGMRLSKITVIGADEKNQNTKYKKFLCRCDCGLIFSIYKQQITGARKIKSCRACANKSYLGKNRFNKHAEKHGHSQHELYPTWKNMIKRCKDINDKKFKNYGGRGISVCEMWLDFNNFVLDMGERPGKEMTLDRINVNGNYEPTNCRWATQKTQQNNRRDNRIIEAFGEKRTAPEWQEITGISAKIIRQRIDRDGCKNPEDIFKPVNRSRKKEFCFKKASVEIVHGKNHREER